MRLTIDIPEQVYRASQIMKVRYEDTIQIPLEVIANGIPLEQHRNITNEEMYQQLIHLEAENERLHDALELQKPKTGKWIDTSEGTVCSKCGKYPYDDGEYHIANWSSNYCPNCGAEMSKDCGKQNL